ncbi:tetratricopeptide repeat-containing sensor histidine kinase [Lacinutrix sp. Hel_I_90]|uniref:tetratricopeptide repeat-containing sensor histidine kinase n=1 Tax=Lacinutrix sp. Hel_I_90 TaxID=1249999 RepID=UPI0005C9C070|nr:tetratricopeptide repeat-containing sensor histidine kinase [Lacinutrix sp. Hel_I_90]
MNIKSIAPIFFYALLLIVFNVCFSCHNENEGAQKKSNTILLKEAYDSFKTNDSLSFKRANEKAYLSSLKLKDTSGIAETDWNYAYYYTEQEIYDSAYYYYYKSYKGYESINDNYHAGKMLYNMAFIQSRFNDYSNSEENLFQAIAKLKPLEKNTSLYRCYNLLGTIYKNLGDYDNAINFYNISLEYLKKADDKKTFKSGTLNDLALTYQQQNKYTEAIASLELALKTDSLYFKNKKLYAMILDNLGHTKLINNDTANVKPALVEALKIRAAIEDNSGTIVNKLHLADYYIKIKDTKTAVNYAKEANVLATSINNNRDILSSLLLLSKIDKSNTNAHLNKYLALNNDLEINERQIKNKFARIRFETDKYIDETKRLTFKNTILLISAFAIIAILSLLYFLKLQRSKNKRLFLETQQQQANEEIYKLMLNQQTKLEEGRLKERNRISEELHDGVLGKIFGTRMGLGFLDIQGDAEAKKKQQNYIDELQDIEKEIRTISHDLKNELLLSKQDYTQLLKTLIETQSHIGKFSYSLENNASTYLNEATDGIKINFYRIVQEALLNITKHANAQSVKISFNFQNGNISCIIHDDGIGFKSEKATKGIGLSNIASRVETLHGKYSIKSNRDIGTKLTILIPFKTKTDDNH